jgi:hypothetical protein
MLMSALTINVGAFICRIVFNINTTKHLLPGIQETSIITTSADSHVL